MIFIPGNVPSLKNSKVKTGRGIFHSPTVSKYLRSVGIQHFNSGKKIVKGYVAKDRPNLYELQRENIEKMKDGLEYPLILGVHHVRSQNRLYDFGNSVELIQDLFTAHDFIIDDNVKYLYTSPMTIIGKLISARNKLTNDWYSVDKEKPGVYLKLF
jgi:hypothetical protein